MYSPITIFGLPFNPSLDMYWVEPSSTIPTDIKNNFKMFKKVVNQCCKHGYPLSDFLPPIEPSQVAYDYFGADMSQFPHLGDAQSELMNFYTEHLQHQLDRATKPKDLERIVLGHFGLYYSEFTFYAQSNKQRYKSLWFYKTLKEFTAKQWSYLQTSHQLPECTPAELVDLLIPEHAHAFDDLCHFMTDYGVRYPEHEDSKHLACIFIALHEQRDVPQAVLAAWLLALKTADEIYLAILSEFAEAIKLKAGHLVNLKIFLPFHTAIHTDGFAGSMYDNFVKLEPALCALQEIFDDTRRSNKLVYLQLLQVLHEPRLDPEQTVIDSVNECAFGFARRYQLNRDQIASISKAHRVPISNLLVLMTKVGAIFHRASFRQIIPTEDECRNAQLRIDDIHKESVELAKTPLENLTKLQALKQELDELQARQIERQQLIRDSIEQAISNYNSLINGAIEQFDSSSEEREKTELQSRLDAAHHEMDALLRDIDLLTQKTEKPLSSQSISDSAISPKPDYSLDDAIFVLGEKNPLVAFVTLLASKRPWVILSTSLIKQLNEIKGFSRIPDFMTHLDKLTSSAFIETHQQKGSEGTFSFFTKIQLSFKESVTTMSNAEYRAQREFTFIEGGTEKRLTCEPHLRIGVSNKEQEQLRVHFVIEDGRLYLGYIGRHLPTGA